jgi:kynurenine formamidase
MLRTGWARHWDDPSRYLAQLRAPGIEEPGGQWFSTRKVFAARSDTLALERLPSATMPVHVHLLVEHGIHILEALNLEELARDRIYEFLFVAVPLKTRGGTGSPIRPLALIPNYHHVATLRCAANCRERFSGIERIAVAS